MDEVLEISSDSNDTIILPQNHEDGYLDNILNEFNARNTLDAKPSKKEDHDFSDEDIIDLPLIKRIRQSNENPGTSSYCELSKKTNFDYLLLSQKSSGSSEINSEEFLSSFGSLPNSESTESYNYPTSEEFIPSAKESEPNLIQDVAKTGLSKKGPRQTKQKDTDKEAARLDKLKEKALKKQAAEDEKALKKATMSIEKSIKPDECMKFITIHLDTHLVEEDFGKSLIQTVQESELTYKVEEQIFPNVISWSRKTQSIENKVIQTKETQENHYLLIMNCKEFVGHIVNKTLLAHIQSFLSIISVEHLTLAVVGLTNYFQYCKSVTKKEFRSLVSQTVQKDNKMYGSYKNLPIIPRKDIDYIQTELQITISCYMRILHDNDSVGEFILECTKALAQLPYKKMKQAKYQQESEYFSGDNKDCVRVDKNGNGLGRLWSQVLTMFPLARLETAEAIASVYPTPLALWEAYENCDPNEREKLLQDIPIRRAAGPLTSIRKIGPEFSRKAYNFFCSNEDILL